MPQASLPGGVSVAEAAAQLEVLAVGGFECVLEGVHFVAVTASQFGELGGEGADHAAWVVLGRAPAAAGGGVLLLGAELFHSFADLRAR